MRFEICEETLESLQEYVRVPIAFEVSRVFYIEVQGDKLDEFLLSERKLDVSYVKDYDAIESPMEWAKTFDISNWGLFVARSEGLCVGGATVAFNTAGFAMLEGRKDLAVLWDIRVAKELRGQGIGSALFKKAEMWARKQNCVQLKVETQNINVPACRFYAHQECTLGATHPLAYPDLPNEIQMLWYKDLAEF